MKSGNIAIIACVLSALFAKAEDVQRTCRVIFVDRPQDSPSKAYLYDGAASSAVDLSSMDLSGVTTIPDASKRIWITAAPVDKIGDIPPDSPSLEIPDATGDFYVILVHDPTNKTFPASMVPIKPGDGRPAIGETLWINLSKHGVKGNLGDLTLAMAPGASHVSKAPLGSPGYYKVTFYCQIDGVGEFQPVMNKTWWHDPTASNLGLIFDSDGKIPKVITLMDRRHPEAPN